MFWKFYFFSLTIMLKQGNKRERKEAS